MSSSLTGRTRGEVAEWLKAIASKAIGSQDPRGFESHPLRPVPVAQWIRASVSGTEGRRFESSQGRMAKKKSKREFSAGGVVYRKREKGEIEWLICRHSGHHKWIFPKGLYEKGEKAEETALREVEEECGIKAKIVAKIKEPEKFVYQFKGTLIFKHVVYFLMEYVSGRTKDHDWEVEELAWLPYNQALKELEFKGTKKVLEAAKKLLEETEKQEKLF